MGKREKLNGADYLLLLLYLNNCEPIESAVRLTKMMFLFEKEISPLLKKDGAEIGNLPQFEPYNYGPFSKDVYEQIELFQSIKFLQVKNLKNKEKMSEVDDWEENEYVDEMGEPDIEFERKADGKYYQYSLLKKGKEYVRDKIMPEVTTNQKNILETYKTRITSTSIKAILRYVYTKYPEMTKQF